MHNNFLKKYYFIDKFDKNHLEKLDNKVHIIYRNYKNVYNPKLLEILRDFCKKRNFKLYLSNNVKLALKLNIDGVYFPSFNKSLTHNCFKFKKNFDILGSAHNKKELNIKISQNVKDIFIAPVFKKNTRKLGVHGFLKLRKTTAKNLIVLGGIKKSNINMVRFLKAEGYAAIEYFKKKGPLNKGP